MQFPDASVVLTNMLYPQDGTAFDMLTRFINSEYVDPADMYMRAWRQRPAISVTEHDG